MHTVYKERYVGLCSQVSSYWNSSVAFYKCVFLFPWGTLRAVCCKSSVYPTRVFNNYDSLSTWYVSDTLTTATTLWDRNSHVYWVKENTEASSSSPLNVDKWSEFLGQTQVPWLDIHGGGLMLWFFFKPFTGESLWDGGAAGLGTARCSEGIQFSARREMPSLASSLVTVSGFISNQWSYLGRTGYGLEAGEGGGEEKALGSDLQVSEWRR